MTAYIRNIRMATACLFATSSVSLAFAQEPSVGIVRISDTKAAGVQMAGHDKIGEFHSVSGYDPYGHGFDGDCPHCHGQGKHKGGKFCEHYCTHSPDHGYSIPGKWPIHRRGVQYWHYYPSAWYGTPNANFGPAAPQVYTPTDTTQLGYYYQHVPFWQPQPNPLPPRPVPAQWHHYAPVVYASQFRHGYTKGGMLGSDCPVYYETLPEATTPASADGTLQPVPEPTTTEPPPAPAPIQESAVPRPLERVSY